MKNLQLTPEWVLEKLPHSHDVDRDGKVSVYTNDATNANFIELALDSLLIEFEAYDYLNDDNDLVFGFDFKLKDIEEDCPEFYLRMWNIKSDNLTKKLQHHLEYTIPMLFRKTEQHLRSLY